VRILKIGRPSSVLVLHIAPTALELGLVCALLGTQCGAPFALIAVATVGSYTQFTLAVTARRNELRRRLNSKDNNLHAELGQAHARTRTHRAAPSQPLLRPSPLRPCAG
jgi:ABC-type transport system involved in Fe-S cluster assembly fused permease/ATPase subunit